MTPVRVLDTRATGALRHGQVATRQVAGVPGSGVPATGVLAVAMNITVVSPTAAGYLTAWPTGAAQPPTSNLNFKYGQNVPNLVVSAVGAGGNLNLLVVTPTNGGGSAHVLVDVVGWYASSSVTTRAARLIPVTPRRLLDTRATGAVGENAAIALRITGNSPVPANNITGVVLNVTAVSPTAASTYVTVYPDGAPPNASNLNLVRGQTRPNLVMVKVGGDGYVRLYNRFGSVHLLADVVGYYQTGAGVNTFAGRVVPLSAPFRAFDTREYATRLGPNQREAWNFQPFVSSLASGGAAVGPLSGLIMNVTSTGVSANTFLSLMPDSAPVGVPSISTLNPEVGSDIPNLAVVQLSKGSRVDHVAAYNFAGYLHYLADVTAVILSD